MKPTSAIVCALLLCATLVAPSCGRSEAKKKEAAALIPVQMAEPWSIQLDERETDRDPHYNMVVVSTSKPTFKAGVVPGTTVDMPPEAAADYLKGVDWPGIDKVRSMTVVRVDQGTVAFIEVGDAWYTAIEHALP